MPILTGSDGACALATENFCVFNTWSATVTRTVHDVTGFGDTGRRRLLGLLDVTGSAGGVAKNDAANTSPGPGAGLNAAGDVQSDITLTFDAAPTLTKWVFGAVIDSIAANVTMGGESTLTFNFQLASGSTVTETWDES